MDNILFVTSFNERGRLQYGQRMLEAWAKLSDWDIVVYLEDSDIQDCPVAANISYRFLPMDMLRLHDIEQHKVIRRVNDPIAAHAISGNYRFQAAKFARKIIAITDPDIQNGVDWLIWIDADTIPTRVLSATATDEILSGAERCFVAYLGRKNWHHSECGFVAYNMNIGGKMFLHRLRTFYNTMQHYTLPEWHDSYVFDHVRQKMEDDGYTSFDLSHGIDLGSVAEFGNEALHIWPHTVLGKYFNHYKGAKKHAAV